MKPFEDATPLLDAPDALRDHASEHGYLLLRGLLARDAVLDVAETLGQVMARHGWIEPNRPVGVARADMTKRCVEPQPPFMRVFYEQLSVRALHALKSDPNILRVFESLFARTPLCVPHCVMRLAFPGMDEYATPAHRTTFTSKAVPRTGPHGSRLPPSTNVAADSR